MKKRYSVAEVAEITAKEQLEWMAKNNVDFFADTKMADGTKNHDWCYALHLDQFEGDHTYICIIERA